MNDLTKIEWADYTFNPWVGCQKVSPGCDHCYAESWAKRSGQVQWGPHAERRRTTSANWRKPLKWERLARETGQRRRVFCASLADVFDNAVPNEWRADLWDLIRSTPNLDWLLVTKRIGNTPDMLPMDFNTETYPHVWLGITVTNQSEADRDIPRLLGINARVRFISMEPLLDQVDIVPYIGAVPHNEICTNCGSATTTYQAIDWVIVGGESGPGARPMRPEWVRALRDSCIATATPFLFKQWGGTRKALTGRELDGRMWDEIPK